MTLRALFVAADGRTRAPWRILLFLALLVCCAVVVMTALGRALRPLDAFTGVRGTGESIGLTIALLMAHGIMLGLIDPAGWRYVRMHREALGVSRLGAGFGIGLAPIGATCALLLVVGWLDIRPAPDGPWWGAAIRVSLALLPAAFWEELLSRGYIFSALSDGLGRVMAAILTSAAFGLMHLWNPGWTAGNIASVALAGVFLTGVLLATESLYAAWLAHFAFNWVMAVPLHVEVSGISLPTPDYRTVDAGPDWATGGRWGPEGGAIAAAAMILALLLLYLVGSGKWVVGFGSSASRRPEPKAQSTSQERPG